MRPKPWHFIWVFGLRGGQALQRGLFGLPPNRQGYESQLDALISPIRFGLPPNRQGYESYNPELETDPIVRFTAQPTGL